ncbi:MAG: murein L,D-transpeptidase [Deltaproteobacteria bacterium]|nr:murein L,D-transpeptidase [Deltaproteobacteria bacterium]
MQRTYMPVDNPAHMPVNGVQPTSFVVPLELPVSPAPPSDTSETPLGPRTTPLPGAPDAALAGLGTRGFQGNAKLRDLALGAVPPIVRGAPKNDAVQIAQTALYSLGFIGGTGGCDGRFGPKSEAAIRAFQDSVPIPQTGVLDQATVIALDQAASAQIARLLAETLPVGSKRGQFQIVADLANTAETRVYVLGADGSPVARYLTSPGTRQHPTRGERFTIRRVLPRRPWIPPQSAWAAGLQQVPQGIHNPMGILKLDFGAYAQYLHGIPQGAEADLGRAASHGCLRLSGANILELHERYAECGTEVRINRGPQRSAALRAAFAETGLADRPLDAGRAHMFGYCYGDLGQYQQL